MEHILPFEVCFNHLSLHAEDPEHGFDCLHSSILGMIYLHREAFPNAPGYIYYASEDPWSDFFLCDGYSLRDFLDDLGEKDLDTYEVFLDFADKTPFTTGLDAQQCYQVAQNNCTILGYHGETIALHYHALLCSGYLLSLPCGGWDQDHINCFQPSTEQPFTIANLHCADAARRRANVIQALRTEEANFPRVFDIGEGKIYIYFEDHAPPHVHFRSSESSCCLTLNTTPKLFCGEAPCSIRKLKRYIRNHYEIMKKSWNYYCTQQERV